MNRRRVDHSDDGIQIRFLFFVIIAVLLTSGIIAYNIDGIYSENRSQISAILPSDYSGGEEIVLPMMVSNLNGEGLEDRDVKVFLERDDQSRLLYEGKTDENGLKDVEFDLPEGNYEGKLLIKSEGQSIEKNINVQGETRLFVSTDKPIYQPGQTVHIRSLCFVGDNPLEESKKVTYIIKTPNGDKVFKKEFTPDEYGISYYNYTLSDLLPLGKYELKVSVEDTTVKEMFLVDEYVLPKFSFNYRGLKDWYLIDEDISGTIDAEYFFGKNVNGQATVKMEYNDKVIQKKTGYLEDGQMPFYFDPLYGDIGRSYFTLNTTITDNSGHSEWDTIDIPMAEKPIDIELLSSKNLVDTESKYTIRITHPDGSPVSDIEVKGSLDDRSLTAKNTSSGGVITWHPQYDGEDELNIVVSYLGEDYTEVFKISKDTGVKILPVDSDDQVGENKRFKIYYQGTSLTNRIYYSVQTQNRILYSDYFVMDEEPYDLTIPVIYEMSPTFRLTAYSIEKNQTFTSDSVTISIDQTQYLDMSIKKDRSVYKPGQNSNIDFKVTKNGQPTNAAIGVKITDEAIYELNQLSGLKEILTKGTDDKNKTERIGFEVLKSGMTRQDVKQIKDDWVSSYWTFITLLGIVSVIGMFFLSLKYRPAASCLIAGLLVVGMFYTVYMEGMNTGSVDLGENAGAPEAGLQNRTEQEAVDGGDGFFDGRDEAKTSKDQEGKSQEQGSSEVREYFPETWYWDPTLITDDQGKASLNLTVPDSITNWMVDAVASTKQGEMTGNSTNITVFKEFFIEPDIPVSAVRGDRFELRVMVYNYQDKETEAEVVLHEADWFTLMDQTQKKINLGANSVGSVSYTIKTEKVGEHEINIDAKTEENQDQIIRIMNVKPDGKKKTDAFNGQLTNDDTANITFTSSKDIVPNSEKAYLKLYGGMDSVTLDSAEGFIHQVTGCGEQSMSTLSIDVLAFNIVKNSENPPDSLSKYEKIVVQGIQHELSFLKEAKNGKGRGIVWFPQDQDVHPWLTSWGLITFQDAIDAGFTVDERIMTDMQDWLVSQQNSNGSWKFPEWGLYETTNQILRSKQVATTAYIARSLLYSGYDESSSPISKAMDYLNSHIENHWDDPYTLAISALTMKLAGNTDAKYDEITDRLDELKKEDNGTYHWESETSMTQGEIGIWRGESGTSSKSIETTGYAIMALSGPGYVDTVDGAVQYLLDNRNQFGTFFSTQDTVVALQAIQRSSGDVEIDEIDIEIIINGHDVETIEFTQYNKDLMYLVDLREYLNLEDENNVTLITSGEGKLAYTLVYEEYVKWEVKPIDTIYFDAEIPETCRVDNEMSIDFTVRYKAGAPYTKMGLIEIPLPTGFRTMNYDHLLEKEKISNWEIKDGSLLIYLTDLTEETSVDFSISFIPTTTGEITVQGIHYYDMYAPQIDVDLKPYQIKIIE